MDAIVNDPLAPIIASLRAEARSLALLVAAAEARGDTARALALDQACRSVHRAIVSLTTAAQPTTLDLTN